MRLVSDLKCYLVGTLAFGVAKIQNFDMGKNKKLKLRENGNFYYA